MFYFAIHHYWPKFLGWITRYFFYNELLGSVNNLRHGGTDIMRMGRIPDDDLDTHAGTSGCDSFFSWKLKSMQELNSTGAISLMLAFMHLSFVILGCCWLHSLVWSSISRLKPNEKVTSLCLSRKYSNTARIDAEECVRAKKVLWFTLHHCILISHQYANESLVYSRLLNWSIYWIKASYVISPNYLFKITSQIKAP